MLSTFLAPAVSAKIDQQKVLNQLAVDTLVIGAGPAGRKTANTVKRHGHSCILVDGISVPGGANLVAGAVPSKAFWKFVEQQYSWKDLKSGNIISYERGKKIFAEVKRYVKDVITSEANDNFAKVRLEESDTKKAPLFLNSWASFLPDGRVQLQNEDSTRIVEAAYIAIAVGSKPRELPNLKYIDNKIVSSDSILSIKELPQSMVIVGAGIVGIEYACYFRALGVDVTIINRSEGVLTGTESIIEKGIAEELKSLGIKIIPNESIKASDILSEDLGSQVTLTLTSDKKINADIVLVAAGRVPNTAGLNTDAISGLTEFCQSGTIEPKVFTVGKRTIEFGLVGDITREGGVVGTALNHGYMLGEHFGSNDPVSFEKTVMPTAIFSFPPAAYVGLTEAQAKEKGFTVLCAEADVSDNAMSAIDDGAKGSLKLVFCANSGALLGAHMIGELAHEIINIAVDYINREGALTDLQNCGFSYPSLGGLYRQASHQLKALISTKTISINDVTSDRVTIPGRLKLAEQLKALPLNNTKRESFCIQPEEVLCIYKTSRWALDLALCKGNTDFLEEWYQSQGIDYDKHYQSHCNQEAAKSAFQEIFPEARFISRDEYIAGKQLIDQEGFKAIVSLGGDNNAQWVSHHTVSEQIMIGVNSDSDFSAGNTLTFNAKHFNEIREKLLSGNFQLKPYSRIEAELNGKKLPHALSEIFVGERDSQLMSTSAYDVFKKVDRNLIKQKSDTSIKNSGFLFATSTGCAGWGGAVLKEQFLLTPKLDPTALGIVQISRETFSQSEGNDRFLPEVLSDGSEVHVYSRNHSDPIVAVDSDRDTTYAFPRGSVLKVRLSDQPCWWMVA